MDDFASLPQEQCEFHSIALPHEIPTSSGVDLTIKVLSDSFAFRRFDDDIWTTAKTQLSHSILQKKPINPQRQIAVKVDSTQEPYRLVMSPKPQCRSGL